MILRSYEFATQSYYKKLHIGFTLFFLSLDFDYMLLKSWSIELISLFATERSHYKCVQTFNMIVFTNF